jgi:D-hexose-6-phosphate mutarotase
MNIIELENNNWNLEINLDGGRVVSLSKDNQKILGTFDRVDGKQGNTHICTPNFANEGVEKFGFIFHGPFRNTVWNLVSQSENSLEISCEIKGLLVTQKFKIENEFWQSISVKNKSKEKKRINVAIHNYWDTEFGWQGTKLNGMDITEGIKNNPEVELKEENLLEFPGKKTVVWKVENFKLAKLWTGVKEENGVKIFDQKYVCIEPEMEFEGFVETEKSWLIVGGEIKLSQKIDLI